MRLVLTRDATTQGVSEQEAVPDSHISSNFCTMKSCRYWTAHVGERRAVVGVGTIGEQAK